MNLHRRTSASKRVSKVHNIGNMWTTTACLKAADQVKTLSGQGQKPRSRRITLGDVMTPRSPKDPKESRYATREEDVSHVRTTLRSDALQQYKFTHCDEPNGPTS